MKNLIAICVLSIAVGASADPATCIKRVWDASEHGERKGESGILILDDGSCVGFTQAPATCNGSCEDRLQFRVTIPPESKILAIVHTHPRKADGSRPTGWPGPGDVPAARQVNAPNFILSLAGVSVACPNGQTKWVAYSVGMFASAAKPLATYCE